MAPRTVTFGSPLGFHCTAPWSGAAYASPALFAHCGSRQGRAPWRGRSRGRSGSVGPLLCGRCSCAPSPWALGPWPSPSPWVGPRLCRRWSAPGALGLPVGVVASAPSSVLWAVPLLCSLGSFLRAAPSGSPLLRRLRRRFFSASGDVAF